MTLSDKEPASEKSQSLEKEGRGGYSTQQCLGCPLAVYNHSHKLKVPHSALRESQSLSQVVTACSSLRTSTLGFNNIHG